MVAAFSSEWRIRVAMLLAASLPVVIALALTRLVPVDNQMPVAPISLRPAIVGSVQELHFLFSRYDYTWPPQQQVPALAVKTLPTGLAQLSVDEKKSTFFRILLPIIVAENARLELERDWLLRVKRGEFALDFRRLNRLAERYGLEAEREPGELVELLLHRVDTLPTGLVLAQAANESGWGTSRFSREVNNLFGQWTWNAAQGIVPLRRPDGASYFIRRFSDLHDSVRAYMHNLNSGHAYVRLRQMRAKMRAEGRSLDPVQLATGLERYSIRGEAYVDEIQAMILGNGLNKLGPLDLVH